MQDQAQQPPNPNPRNPIQPVANPGGAPGFDPGNQAPSFYGSDNPFMQNYQATAQQPMPAATPIDPSNGVPTAPSPAVQAPATQNVQAKPPGFDPSNSGLIGPNSNVQQMMQDAQNAAYKQATGYLDPQFATQEETLRSSLANQGIPQGSQAWQQAMDEFNRNKAFAYGQAENQAYGQGLSAQQQVAQQLLQQMGFQTSKDVANIGASASRFGSMAAANTAAAALAEQHAQNQFANSMGLRQEDINELLLQQGNPLSQIAALTGGQGPQQPNFTQTPSSNINPTDIASIIAQATGQQNNVYNAQTGAANSGNAGMASIIAALLSDRRLKTNIRQIGMHTSGVPLYSYNYITGEPGFGVLADELEQVRPDAVFDDPETGFKMVDYGAISERD